MGEVRGRGEICMGDGEGVVGIRLAVRCLGLVRADAVGSNRVSREWLVIVYISSVRYIFCISNIPMPLSVLNVKHV